MKIVIFLVILAILLITVGCVAKLLDENGGEFSGTKTLVQRLGNIEIWKIHNTFSVCYIAVAPTNVDISCLK